MKRLLILLAFLVFPSLVHAREGWRDWCQMGNRNVVTSGLNSTTKVQQSFPQCTITIYVHGGGKAKIYNDNNGTEKANPFTSDLDGQFIWYANNGRYDQTTTSAGMPQPITMSDILLCDPADAAGGSCGTASGGGCSLSGFDTGVVSEHPVGSCYDSLNFTWDDGTNKQNLQAGTGNTVGDQETFIFGFNNEFVNTPTAFPGGFIAGDNNSAINTVGTFLPAGLAIIGSSNNASSNYTGGNYEYILGAFNDIKDSQFSYILGDSNTIYNSQDVVVLNLDNCIGKKDAGGFQRYIVLSGFNNQANGGCGSSPGTATMAFVGIYGDANGVNGGSGTGHIEGAYLYGFTNQVDTKLGQDTNDIFMYGLDNHADGSPTADVVIVGSSNFAFLTNGTQDTGAADNFIGGFLNVSMNSGNFFDLGGANFTNCNVCGAIGFNGKLATNNTVSLGFSTVPELMVTRNNVKLTPLGVTNGPVTTADRNSGGSATGTVGQTCNIAFTGGTGAGGGTGLLYIQIPNSASAGIIYINAGGSYATAPTGGTLTNGTATCSGSIVITSTVGLIPTCNAGKEGSYSAVVDSNTNVWGATIAGGGANHVMAYCDGTNWTVMGK